MDYQDWTPTVLRSASYQATKQIVPKRSEQARQLAKIEKDEYTKPKMLSSESRQELLQRRLVEKLTQQQLDNRCAFPLHTIRDLEANKRAPTSKELQTLNRVLKCGLKLTN